MAVAMCKASLFSAYL